MDQIIHFEDKGQNFTRWLVHDGVVIGSDDKFGAFVGVKLVVAPVIGERPLCVFRSVAGRRRLDYNVTRIEDVGARSHALSGDCDLRAVKMDAPMDYRRSKRAQRSAHNKWER